MKKGLIKILFITLFVQIYQQKATGQVDKIIRFDTIISHFKKWYPFEGIDSLPLIAKEKYFSIEISDKPIFFDLKKIVLKNPFNNKYPISFSLIYQNRLIALFEPGYFVCFVIPSLERDFAFEKLLNTRKFQYHWIIDNQLIGRSKNQYFYLNPKNKWLKYKSVLPLRKQPKLFDDNNYLIFCDCHGEFGGTVYFYNRKTKKIHFTEATCANSIYKNDHNYYVLSQLGHGLGSTDLKNVSNPEKLPIASKGDMKKSYNRLGYSDKTNEAKLVFDFYGIQFFSSFFYQDRNIYLVNWRGETFLAEVQDSTIKIINPLFNKGFYTHNPVTIKYDDAILINLTFWGTGLEREVSCILIKDDKLIKIDWNEEQKD